MTHVIAAKQLSGQTIGDYVVGDIVGSGSFCVVYTCTVRRGNKNKQLPRTAAIKVIKDPEDMRYFTRETRAIHMLRGVNSPNVVKFLGIGTMMYTADDGASHPISWIMMEQLGCSLSRHLRRITRMSLVDTMKVARGIFTGLAAMHSVGVVHSDVKPSNIMFRGEAGTSAPVIVDMGSATSMVGPKSSQVGTWMYNAPELLFLGDYSAPADVWSTMAIVFEMMTGDVLFDVYHDSSIMYGGGLDLSTDDYSDETSGGSDGSSEDSIGSSGDSNGSSEDLSCSDSASRSSDSDDSEDTAEEINLGTRLVQLWCRVLGSPPDDFVNAKGAKQFIGGGSLPEPLSLNELLHRNYNLASADSDALVSFVSRGLQYRPADRITAKDAAQRCRK